MSTDQTELTQLLNATIASANPDPLRNPQGVYWGDPLSFASGTGEPLAFTLALPTGYQSVQQLFAAAEASGPRILVEVHDAINTQVDWYTDPANAKGFHLGSNQIALARQLSSDGGRSYWREFFAESFSTDRYQFRFQPFTADGDFSSKGWLTVTALETPVG